jgi:aminopeptidase YwaD
LGRGGEGSLATREGEIHHGADDNASGTAGLLELARLLSQEKARVRRTVVFIAFSGEEEGLIGSSFYVNNPARPLEQTVAMINMDMIGRLKDEALSVGGVGTADEWRGWIEEANKGFRVSADPMGNGTMPSVSDGVSSAQKSGSEAPIIVTGSNGRVVATATPTERFALRLNEDGYGPSDHSSFYLKRVPVLFFFTGSHEDYHKPSDTADRINYDGEARVLEFVREIIYDLQAATRRPTFAVAKMESNTRSTGFRVYLGTMPSYADSTNGLKLDGVKEGSPAEKAGLKAGDVVVKLAGRDIKNVYDYTQALSEMKAGQEYEVEVMREGQRVSLKLTPTARK